MLRAVPFDVLIVLGCRVDGGELSHAALRRVERAARAYAEDGASLVIASGGKRWQGNMECEVFARGLRERGVPEQCLLLERASLTTRGNALGSARLLRARAVERSPSIGVVTCDWHMPRAQRLFALAGLSTVAVPAASPRRALGTVLLRSAREHGSLLLDLLVAPLWQRS